MDPKTKAAIEWIESDENIVDFPSLGVDHIDTIIAALRASEARVAELEDKVAATKQVVECARKLVDSSNLAWMDKLEICLISLDKSEGE